MLFRMKFKKQNAGVILRMAEGQTHQNFAVRKILFQKRKKKGKRVLCSSTVLFFLHVL